MGAAILGLLGLGLTLALAAGRKKDKARPVTKREAAKDMVRSGVPVKDMLPELREAAARTPEAVTSAGIPQFPVKRDTTPAPPSAAPPTDWRAWLAGKLMAAYQSHSVSIAQLTALELHKKSQDPRIPADIRSLMLQASAALVAAAEQWQSEAKATTAAPLPEPTVTRTTEPVYMPPPPPPPSPAEVIQVVDTTAKKTLALDTNNHLKATTKSSYDREKVRRFQAQEGLKTDGLYGVNTGLAIGGYGIIPRKPHYVGTKAGGYASYVADKDRWNATMRKFAELDPSRATQWRANTI